MNNKNRLIWMCGATLLMLASCSQDEMQTGDNPAKGICPVEIGGVTVKSISSGEPQTRMTENDEVNTSSVFEDGDQITISANNGTETRTGTYQIEAVDGSDTYSISALDGLGLYWNSTSEQLNITASYPVDTDIDLSDQSSGLKYVLKATTTVSYGSSVPLSFSHQLSKISVQLRGTKTDIIADAAKVEVYAYTSCTNTEGTVALADGAKQDWIPMMKKRYTTTGTCWEANVVPGLQISQMRVTTNSGNSYTYSFSSITPTAGMLYNVMLKFYGKEDNIIDLSKLTGDRTITASEDNSILTNETSYKVTVASGVSVTLDYATINNQLEFKGGNSTLTLVGENNVATNAVQTSAILLSGAGTLTIDGTDVDVLTATASGDQSCGIEGTNANANIKITGGVVNAKGGSYGPGIGAISSKSCGDITITGGTVTAQSGRGTAGIGTGYQYSNCGTITIKNSGTIVRASGGEVSIADIGIGSNYSNSCDGIQISESATVTTISGGTVTYNPDPSEAQDD